MKTLLVLRHAKSSWKHVGLTDHDRPLNKRGKRDAPRMGALMADEDIVPDLILSSTAKRARTTARRAAAAAGYEGEIELREDLYHAAPSDYIDAVAAVSEAVQRVMVVGHNPGMESLVEVLTGHVGHFPTAALAWIELDIDEWPRIYDGGGRLVQLWRPRELH